MGSMDWADALPWLALAATVAATGAWLARIYGVRRGLLDLPGDRRSHSVATPRGGGIGIAFACMLVFAGLGVTGTLAPPLAMAAVLGTLLVAAAGYIDDHRPLSPWWRLAVHAAAGATLALAALAGGWGPGLALLAFCAVPVLVNVWNFMDGIDGLAASQAALVSAGFALLSSGPAVTLVALAVCASCVGFLPFNFPRARIFLGDVGSGTLGFVLALLLVLLLAEAGEGWAGAAALAVLPLSAFLVDATLTLGRRIVRREQWWTAHVTHAYQRLAARTGSHVRVTLAYGAWTSAAVLVALMLAGHGFRFRLAVAAAVIAIAAVSWRAARDPGADVKQ